MKKKTWKATKDEFSAGGIIFRKNLEGQIQYLLIKDGYGRWTWPKGRIEKDEDPKRAAIREVSEETGLKKIKIVGQLPKNRYIFRKEDFLVFKTVWLYLIQADSKEKVSSQKEEILEAKWFTPNQVSEILAYKGTDKIFKKALKLVKNLKI